MDSFDYKVNETFLKFLHPFTCLTAGSTSSGKTFFVRNLINFNKIEIDKEKIKILWCYGIYQEIYKIPLKKSYVLYYEGLPDTNFIIEFKPDLIVIDDLMTSLDSNKDLSNLFTRGSHHLKFSIIFIVQNIFHQGKYMRNISLNSNYIVLMKNVRDKKQISNLGSQVFPGKVKSFVSIYDDATKDPFSHLVLDFKQQTPEEYRIKSKIFSKNPVLYRIK